MRRRGASVLPVNFDASRNVRSAMNSAGMTRCVIAAVLGGLFLAIAAGLVYFDARAFRIAYLRLLAVGNSPAEARARLDNDLPTLKPVMLALPIGAVGAACTAGSVIATAWKLAQSRAVQR